MKQLKYWDKWRGEYKEIPFPVSFTLKIKPVWANVSRPYGTGRATNSTVHVYLLEPLRVGRLKRSAGEYLCSQPKGEYAPNNYDVFEGVTCKRCREMAIRLAGE